MPSTEWKVRKVEKIGQLNWKGVRIFISETLQGEYVGLKRNQMDIWECYYGPIYLGEVSSSGKLERPKMERRRQR